MILTRWAVPIHGVEPAHVTLEQLHAVASSWVDDSHWSESKPWAIRPLRTADGLAVLEVSTLNDAAAQRLQDSASPGRPVRFGNQHGVIVSRPCPITGTTVEQIRAHAPTDAWCVRFSTPTTFGNRNRFSPWPDPSTIVRSLQRRWNAICDRPDYAIRLEAAQCRAIWVTDLDGRNAILTLSGLTVSGYLGRVRYSCDDKTVAPGFGALLQFAEFAGLGRYTVRGLGVIALEQTWHTSHHR